MTTEELVSFFAPHLSVSIRNMFGGRSVHAEGLIVALEAGGDLYLKADKSTQSFFIDLGCQPLTYERRSGATATLRYYRVPDHVYANERLKNQFVAAAIAIAKRGSAGRELAKRLAQRRARAR
ncbi:MAG: TfoX/Sxy family protein [Rhizobiales bacterium]|nr:TfoX/Sxy family protein [Hyphomicrobiales bacterium]